MTEQLNLELIRQKLERAEAVLLERLHTDSDELAGSVTTPGRQGLGTLYESWKQDQTTDEQDQERLIQVQAALQRIKDGTYGICTQCGGEINPERLSALPYAEHCVRCQKRDESPLV